MENHYCPHPERTRRKEEEREQAEVVAAFFLRRDISVVRMLTCLKQGKTHQTAIKANVVRMYICVFVRACLRKGHIDMWSSISRAHTQEHRHKQRNPCRVIRTRMCIQLYNFPLQLLL